MIQEADISHFYPNLGFRHSRGEGEQRHWLVSRSICPALATKLPRTAQPLWSWAGGVGEHWWAVGTGSKFPQHGMAPICRRQSQCIQQGRAPSSDPANITAGRRHVKEQSDGWESERGWMGVGAGLRGTSASKSQTSKHP